MKWNAPCEKHLDKQSSEKVKYIFTTHDLLFREDQLITTDTM